MDRFSSKEEEAGDLRNQRRCLSSVKRMHYLKNKKYYQRKNRFMSEKKRRRKNRNIINIIIRTPAHIGIIRTYSLNILIDRKRYHFLALYYIHIFRQQQIILLKESYIIMKIINTFMIAIIVAMTTIDINTSVVSAFQVIPLGVSTTKIISTK